MRVGIVGGGVAGLVAAYDLSARGFQVSILERGARLGGLAGSFPIGDGEAVEKYYHFICRGDRAYLLLLRELGLTSRLRWRRTGMGLFHAGAIHPLGDPLSLLRFPHLSPLERLRFALASARAKHRAPDDWRDLEWVTARDWLIEQFGERAYRILYQPLLELKFREFASSISAAWIWARLNRLGNSRSLTQQELLGYLDGGSQAYLDALERALRARGVHIETSAGVDRIVVQAGRAAGIWRAGRLEPFDFVVSTVPLPYARELLSELDGEYAERLRRQHSIGVAVVLLRLRRQFSRYFWMNVSDARIPLPGIVEYTNLNRACLANGDALVYLPQYLPESHPLFSRSDRDLLDGYVGYLRLIDPTFDAADVRQYWVHRDRFAQPICDVGFSQRGLSMQTPIENLVLTDSSQAHPHDRSISESTVLGRRAAELVVRAAARARIGDPSLAGVP